METKFSNELKLVINSAKDLALKLGSRVITPEHLFLAMLQEDEKFYSGLLSELGLNSSELVAEFSKKKPDATNEIFSGELSPSTTKALKIAFAEALLLRQKRVEPYHLLISFLRNEDTLVSQEFNKRSVTFEKVQTIIKEWIETGLINQRRRFFWKWFWQ